MEYDEFLGVFKVADAFARSEQHNVGWVPANYFVTPLTFLGI
jgi:hypothetical protein